MKNADFDIKSLPVGSLEEVLNEDAIFIRKVGDVYQILFSPKLAKQTKEEVDRHKGDKKRIYYISSSKLKQYGS